MTGARCIVCLTVAAVIAGSRQALPGIPLLGKSSLTPIGVTATAVAYRGRRAVRLTESFAPGHPSDFGGVALVDSVAFATGMIDVLVAVAVAPGADTSVRGFAGITFHTSSDASRFENIYLRVTNGRADDQLRRNHAVQYQSRPDHPWYRLRHESPGQYEAYTDLEPGAWTKMRVVVSGTRARLFINGGTQPSLILNDLKLKDRTGRIGLWVGAGTIAYFSQLVVNGRPFVP